MCVVVPLTIGRQALANSSLVGPHAPQQRTSVACKGRAGRSSKAVLLGRLEGVANRDAHLLSIPYPTPPLTHSLTHSRVPVGAGCVTCALPGLASPQQQHLHTDNAHTGYTTPSPSVAQRRCNAASRCRRHRICSGGRGELSAAGIQLRRQRGRQHAVVREWESSP